MIKRKIRIGLFKDEDLASIWIANYFDRFIKENPRSSIGITTEFSSSITTCKLLKKYAQEGTDWSKITFFGIQEFIGLPQIHPGSFRSQITTHLLDGTNIKNKNIHFPNGFAKNLGKESTNYEESIDAKGGIDLQYLSLGLNGSVACTEPGTSLFDHTHMTLLDEVTRETLVKEEKFGSYNETPSRAITVGMQTIMKFKEVLMVSLGKDKAKITKSMLEDNINSDVPSSLLREHRNVLFILDEASAKKINLDNFEVKDFRGYLDDLNKEELEEFKENLKNNF